MMFLFFFPFLWSNIEREKAGAGSHHLCYTLLLLLLAFGSFFIQWGVGGSKSPFSFSRRGGMGWEFFVKGDFDTHTHTHTQLGPFYRPIQEQHTGLLSSFIFLLMPFSRIILQSGEERGSGMVWRRERCRKGNLFLCLFCFVFVCVSVFFLLREQFYEHVIERV